MLRIVPLAVAAFVLAACDMPLIPNDAASGDAASTTQTTSTVGPVIPPADTTPEAREPATVSPGENAPPPPITTEDSRPAAIISTSPPVAGRVAIQTSGTDSCGAVDFAFLTNEPYAITFDIALPRNALVVGRNQKLETVNPNRMLVRVSTRNAGAAENTPDARILSVTCG